ncbi:MULTISPECIES: YdcH family protein [Malaciobacter]|jgi:uncharacterized protein YdcH (DUF465 family)|uniref:DUF465 domain-containing protein n=2 Tax=Malaciobacter TaxID=2321114 RepID=A0AB36ZRY9_9BACT|nr:MULTISPECIES: DUF465 domain-containing protein [Malaciobacter]PHO09800.1 DUF465 domain-containing protein [Malaciobacter canalis]PPK58413.1 hypothetical protein B0F89_13814 [Malaciobacter marinus]QEE33418.1 DUF465 domain-containing protein [Malaciobacter canalis]SKB71514.1 hypothetical protein SAMN06295997_13419 [Malaciobacter marinus]
MFHEHRDVITKLKQENAHFNKLFEKHNELDEEIIELEKNFGDQLEIDKKKKEKLKLKDQVFNLIMEYKNS